MGDLGRIAGEERERDVFLAASVRACGRAVRGLDDTGDIALVEAAAEAVQRGV